MKSTILTSYLMVCTRDELRKKRTTHVAGQAPVVQLDELVDDVPVGRETGQAECLDNTQVLEKQHTRHFQVAHQPHFVVGALLELVALDSLVAGFPQHLQRPRFPPLRPPRRQKSTLFLSLLSRDEKYTFCKALWPPFWSLHLWMVWYWKKYSFFLEKRGKNKERLYTRRQKQVDIDHTDLECVLVGPFLSFDYAHGCDDHLRFFANRQQSSRQHQPQLLS